LYFCTGVVQAQFVCPPADIVVDDFSSGFFPNNNEHDPAVWASVPANFGPKNFGAGCCGTAVPATDGYWSRAAGGDPEDETGEMVSNPIDLQGKDCLCFTLAGFHGGSPPGNATPYLKDDGIDQNGTTPQLDNVQLDVPPGSLNAIEVWGADSNGITSAAPLNVFVGQTDFAKDAFVDMAQNSGFTHVVIKVVDRAGSGNINVSGGFRWLGIGNVRLNDMADIAGLSSSDILLDNGDFFPWQDPNVTDDGDPNTPDTGTGIDGWNVDPGIQEEAVGFASADCWSMTVTGIGSHQDPFPSGLGMNTRGNEQITGRIYSDPQTVQVTGEGAGLRWYYCGWDGKNGRSGPSNGDPGQTIGEFTQFNWFEIRRGSINGPRLTNASSPDGKFFPAEEGDQMKLMELNFNDLGLEENDTFVFAAVDDDSGVNRCWLGFDRVAQVTDSTTTGSICDNPVIPFDVDDDCIFNLPNFVEIIVNNWLDCGFRDQGLCP